MKLSYYITMITIEIMGGLGNQLFQVFTLIAFSLNSRNAFYFEDKNIYNGHRKIVYWSNFLQALEIFVKPSYPVDYLIKEKNFHYNPLPIDISSTSISKLTGYFQSYKYFHEMRQNIMKFMKFDIIKKPYENMYSYEYTISLHFRIGDYKAIQEHHPILSLDYYIKALNYIMSESGRTNWQVLYFFEQEDIDQVDANISMIRLECPTISFLPITNTLSDWEQLIIMSLCKNNIIANSSFSWWGAYLNNNENIVCYPRTWFGPAQGRKNMSDMFLDYWHQIDE